MGIEAIYAKPRTSLPEPGHQIYPYLLRDLEVTGPDQVWCSDITYVPMATGFMYLVAVMDWWSRYVLGWRLSNTMEAAFCVDAWEAALRAGRQAPLISNTDQGSQFTSPMFIDAVESAGVDVSMDGRGRWMDNRFIERLWRSAKYEDIYLQDYGDGLARDAGWAGGLTATTRSVRTRRWTMRRRRTCTLIPAPTEPSRPNGKRCSLREAGTIATLDREAGGEKRLEIRPPAAVELGTLRKRRGRTGSAPHGSFSLFERVLKRGMNDRQAQIEVTASRKSRAYFQRSVV